MRAGAARTALVVTHVVMGAMLLAPAWIVLGGAWLYLASPGVLVAVAVPVWILIMAARLLGRITPGVLGALGWTHAIALGYAAMLGVSSVVMLRAAPRSAERGGGLLGTAGLFPLAVAVVLGGLALIALWLTGVLRRAA